MSGPAQLRRGDKAISEVEELHRIIDEAPVMRLAMVDDGRPYVVPVNFAREGDGLWVHCALEGRKVACLRRDASVCIEVDHFRGILQGSDDDPCTGWTTSYESVIGSGTVAFVDDVEAKVRGLRAIMLKYSGRSDWSFTPEEVARVLVLRVRLDSLTGKRSPA
jgi:nitroimidazol reductase NimA-like FMN-containing flavoprotein (pyridoxamine 5'-phosphate oxidase superfamily)